jgi:hypothetical protein
VVKPTYHTMQRYEDQSLLEDSNDIVGQYITNHTKAVFRKKNYQPGSVSIKYTEHECSNREREIRICTMAQEKRYPNQDITRFKRL